VIYDLSLWGWPEDSLYHGRDGLVCFNEQWIGQWSEPNFDVVSVEELDEPGVLLTHLNLRGIVKGVKTRFQRRTGILTPFSVSAPCPAVEITTIRASRRFIIAVRSAR
jgi:hypothetical protein